MAEHYIKGYSNKLELKEPWDSSGFIGAEIDVRPEGDDVDEKVNDDDKGEGQNSNGVGSSDRLPKCVTTLACVVTPSENHGSNPPANRNLLMLVWTGRSHVGRSYL